MRKLLFLVIFLVGAVWWVTFWANTSDTVEMYYDYPYSYSEKSAISKVVNRVNDLFSWTENEDKSRFELVGKLYPLTWKDKYGNNERLKALI